MLRFPLVRWAAFSWGLVTVFPLGLSYAAFLLLAVAMAVDRTQWTERRQRLRAAPHRWPAWLFLGWCALVLAFGPHYPETSSNAWHVLRIVLVLGLALALAREEALASLRGFALGLLACLAIVLADALWGLPAFVLWDSLLDYAGNKSVAIALMAALAATTLMLCLPLLGGRRRAVAGALVLALMALLAWALPARGAWLAILLAGGIGLAHWARSERRYGRAAMLGLALLLVVAAGVQRSPLGDRIQAGVRQLTDMGHLQSRTVSSISLRYRLYSETAGMVRERPLTGWGVGAWNQKWRERVPAEFASLNMPHNDFLWIGAQAGIPAMLLLLWLVAAGLPGAWRRRDLSGRLGVAALLSMLLALLTTSALRDASIGMSLWFVVLVYQRIALEVSPVWEPALGIAAGSPAPGSA